MKGVGDEGKLTAVMVQHLFSHLIASNDYVIDNRSQNLPKYCPCEMENCKALKKNGCTAQGRFMFLFSLILFFSLPEP